MTAHLAAKNHASTRPSQGLVGSGRHDVSVLKWRGQHARSHKATACMNGGGINQARSKSPSIQDTCLDAFF